jgi:epoxyqueuosine reductase
MNRNLTLKVKEYALDLGADLVGIAPIERFVNAPIMMSPQGLMPTAKNVIVCAIHHPDAAIELGGEKHPQIIGPYSIQYIMNCKLDYIAIRIAKLIESLGYDAIPIASSNIWRYRNFMDLDANFAPDMSHIYAATCAGLGQLGWHGLTMSPEYGPWNRFISIITDAPLCGTPIYDDIKLCDMCGECIKHCPTDAYRKEVNGVKSIEVEGKTFKFANKNLWRCAWGEHFDLDLDLEIPDVVNEEVILENVRKHGRRGGEMGCCLKYCLPEHLRQDGREFTSTYIRKKHTYASDLPVHRRLYDDIAICVQRYAVDNIAFLDEETLDSSGIDYKSVFSPAKGAVVYSISIKNLETGLPVNELMSNHGRGDGVIDESISPARRALSLFNGFANLDITRTLENSGFQALNSVNNAEKYAEIAGLKGNEVLPETNEDIKTMATEKSSEDLQSKTTGRSVVYGAVLTSAAFKRTIFTGLQEPVDNPHMSITENLLKQIRDEGSEYYAIVPVDRMEVLAEKLVSIKGGEKLFLVRDKNPIFREYAPEVHEVQRRIHKPSDYLRNAKNVIIFGLHFPRKVSEMALKPPAYAVGPYVFSTYQTNFELAFSAFKICKYLQDKGYNAVMTADLTGIGGDIGSPRGLLYDAICNSLEAVEAGLGQLAVNGMCYTQKYGMNQRFMAIVTDAPLEQYRSTEDQFGSTEEQFGGIEKKFNSTEQQLNDTRKLFIGTGEQCIDTEEQFSCTGKQLNGTEKQFDCSEKQLEYVVKQFGGIKEQLINTEEQFNCIGKQLNGTEKQFSSGGEQYIDTEEHFDCITKQLDGPKLQHNKITAYCSNCRKCIEACPAKALTWENAVDIELNGVTYKWIPTIGSRCDWAKKYALCGEEGSKYTGSTTEVLVPDRIDPDNLSAALKTSDVVLKFRPTTTERCIIDCPLKLGGVLV